MYRGDPFDTINRKWQPIFDKSELPEKKDNSMLKDRNDRRLGERSLGLGKWIYLIHEHNSRFLSKLQIRTKAKRLDPLLDQLQPPGAEAAMEQFPSTADLHAG